MKTFREWRKRRALRREVREHYEAAVAEWMGAMQDWRESDYGREFEHSLTDEEIAKMRECFLRYCWDRRARPFDER